MKVATKHFGVEYAHYELFTKAVGSVDNLNSTSSLLRLRVLMRPSWGLRFSATFSRPRIFSRLTTAMPTVAGSS